MSRYLLVLLLLGLTASIGLSSWFWIFSGSTPTTAVSTVDEMWQECSSLCNRIHNGSPLEQNIEAIRLYCTKTFTIGSSSQAININGSYICRNRVRCYDLPWRMRCPQDLRYDFLGSIDAEFCAEQLENGGGTAFKDNAKRYSCLEDDTKLWDSNEIPALKAALNTSDTYGFVKEFGAVKSTALIGCSYLFPALDAYYARKHLPWDYGLTESTSQNSLDSWLARNVRINGSAYEIIRSPIAQSAGGLGGSCLLIGTRGCVVVLQARNTSTRLQLILGRDNYLLSTCTYS